MKLRLGIAAFVMCPLMVFAACPEWLQKNKSKLPLCPEGQGVALLPETYPVGAIVVSDGGSSAYSDFTVDVVEKTLWAAGDTPPLVILPVDDETMRSEEHTS